MKKINIVTLVSLFGFMSSLYAIEVAITPTVGKAVIKTDKDTLEDTKVLYGVRGDVFLNNEVAVQGAFETSSDNDMSDGGKTDIERGALNMVYERDNGKRVRPFALVGIGGEKVHRETTPTQNDDSQAFINAGAGLKFEVNKYVDLMTEAKWIKKLENNDQDVVLSVGAGVKMGESKAYPAKEDTSIPSVTAVSDAQNAMNLAEFKKIYGTTKTPVEGEHEASDLNMSAKAVVEPQMIEEPAPAQAAASQPSAANGYYVQVAALFQGNGDAITRQLEAKNYPFTVQEGFRGGKSVKRILVGPYASKKEAGVAIGYLKRVSSNAFITQSN